MYGVKTCHLAHIGTGVSGKIMFTSYTRLSKVKSRGCYIIDKWPNICERKQTLYKPLYCTESGLLDSSARNWYTGATNEFTTYVGPYIVYLLVFRGDSHVVQYCNFHRRIHRY